MYLTDGWQKQVIEKYIDSPRCSIFLIFVNRIALAQKRPKANYKEATASESSNKMHLTNAGERHPTKKNTSSKDKLFLIANFATISATLLQTLRFQKMDHQNSRNRFFRKRRSFPSKLVMKYS